MDEKYDDVCRFCGKQDSKFECSKCKSAKYCSEECQKLDWNVYKHKLVCWKTKE